MPTIYLALGSNLGDREQNLRQAINLLPPQVTVSAMSAIYQTKAVYVEDQPDFLNMALTGETTLPPMALLAYLKQLETEIGRQKSFRYGPRQIDIDILFYEAEILHTPTLEIPHPRLSERSFVLYPLREIAAHLKHPVNQQTIEQLITALPDQAPLEPWGRL